jgi:hypothetical protein
MLIDNTVYEDLLLPDTKTIEEFSFFDDERIIDEMNDNTHIPEPHAFDEGFNDESPENLSIWIENASQKFYA